MPADTKDHAVWSVAGMDIDVCSASDGTLCQYARKGLGEMLVFWWELLLFVHIDAVYVVLHGARWGFEAVFEREICVRHVVVWVAGCDIVC